MPSEETPERTIAPAIAGIGDTLDIANGAAGGARTRPPARFTWPTRFAVGFCIGLGLSIAGTAGLMLTVFHPDPEAGWVHDLYTYKTSLTQRIHGPKILLVGGSNVLFGVSARMIAARTGEPTVNFGTHAGLGAAYHLYRAAKVAKRGDTVVLIDEYGSLLPERRKPTALLVEYALAYDPGYIWSQGLLNYLHYLTRFDYLGALYDLLWRDLTDERKAGYSAQALDSWGDATGNTLDRVTPSLRRRVEAMRPFEAQPVKRGYAAWVLDDFVHEMRRHGIRVLAAWPNYLYRRAYGEPVFRAFVAARRHEFERLGVPVVGTWRQAMMSLDEMYDTNAHPNAAGRVRRTRMLLASLCGTIDCRGAPLSGTAAVPSAAMTYRSAKSAP